MALLDYPHVKSSKIKVRQNCLAFTMSSRMMIILLGHKPEVHQSQLHYWQECWFHRG